MYIIYAHCLYMGSLPAPMGAAVLYTHGPVSNHSDIDAVWMRTNVMQVKFFTLTLPQEHMASGRGEGPG